MSRAMVLAAGLGTRLKPLTDELPKPLVPLGDRPFVAHVAERLRASGLTELVMNTHFGDAHFRQKIEYLDANVHLVHEPVIRGTAGGIAGARALLGPAPIVAWNGDILADPPLERLLSLAESGGLVFAVAPREVREGTVGLDEQGRVVRLRGELFGTEVRGGDYIGVAGIGARALAALPGQGCLIGDYALPALRRGEQVLTAAASGGWSDIGSVPAYHAANLGWLSRTTGPDGSWVHPSAHVGPGIVLRRSIVGEGARIEGAGVVERTVVWPFGHAHGPLSDAIVTSANRVVAVPR